MQPNNYNPQQFQSNQQNGTYFELAGQQGPVQQGGATPPQPPQSAQSAQSQPAQPNAAPKSGSSKGSLIAAILFAIIAVGLGGYLVVDKFILNKPTVAEAAEEAISINIPLGQVDSANYAKALVGRTFVVDEALEQSITFTSDTEYDLNYYAAPSTDIAKYDPSTKHGTYKVEKDKITLDKGDVFTIKNDYLIKSTDNLTSNKSTVYFDLQQYPKTVHNINNAFQQNLSTWGGNSSADADKLYITHASCTTSNSHLTNADAYMCAVEFTLYFGEANIETALQDSSYKTFNQLCTNDSGYVFYKGTCGTTDYSIATNRNLIVRIDNSGNYKIVGIFTDQDIVEEEETDTDDDTSAKDTDKKSE